MEDNSCVRVPLLMTNNKCIMYLRTEIKKKREKLKMFRTWYDAVLVRDRFRRWYERVEVIEEKKKDRECIDTIQVLKYVGVY